MDDWKVAYEKLTDMVVPRSSKYVLLLYMRLSSIIIYYHVDSVDRFKWLYVYTYSGNSRKA